MAHSGYLNNVMVLVRGTALDQKLLEHTKSLLSKNHGNLLILYIITVPRSLPLDVEIDKQVKVAESVLEKSVAVVKRIAHIDTHIIQAREVGYAVVVEAQEKKVDAVVVGAHSQPSLDKFQIDPDILYILENAKCEVILLLSRENGTKR